MATSGRPGGIPENLNGTRTDRTGRFWRLQARWGSGPPSLDLRREQFAQEMPLIVGHAVPSQEVGHAVVITAVICEETGTGPQVVRVLLRDPWPDFRSCCASGNWPRKSSH